MSWPTASITVIFIMLTITVVENESIVAMGIAGAYLSATTLFVVVLLGQGAVREGLGGWGRMRKWAKWTRWRLESKGAVW